MKRKEDFFLNEIKTFETKKIKLDENKILKEKKIKEQKKKIYDIILKFLKENKEKDYTCNTIKKNCILKYRYSFVLEILNEMIQDEVITRKEIKGKVHYKYHRDLTDDIVKIKNYKEQFKVKILKNESEGEIDFSNFYY